MAAMSSLVRTLGALGGKFLASADKAKARILCDKVDALCTLFQRAQGLELAQLRGTNDIDIDTATVDTMFDEVRDMTLEVKTALIQYIRSQPPE